MDEAILKGYNPFIAASELFHEDIITMNDRVGAGTKAKSKVIRFHKWLITTMNDYFLYVEILNICDKEQELTTLTLNMKPLVGQIDIKMELRSHHHESIF